MSVGRELRSNPANREPTGKRPYHPPSLLVYGKVALLTQSGSGNCMSDGSAICGGANTMRASDRSTKEDVVRIGTHPLGIGLYLFNYRPQFREQWGHGRRFGVMANEVETIMPQAVCLHPNGYQMVDYGMLGIRHSVQ